MECRNLQTIVGELSACSRAVGASIATLTIFPEAAVGSMADVVVTLPGATPKKDAGAADSAVSV